MHVFAYVIFTCTSLQIYLCIHHACMNTRTYTHTRLHIHAYVHSRIFFVHKKNTCMRAFTRSHTQTRPQITLVWGTRPVYIPREHNTALRSLKLIRINSSSSSSLPKFPETKHITELNTSLKTLTRPHINLVWVHVLHARLPRVASALRACVVFRV